MCMYSLLPLPFFSRPLPNLPSASLPDPLSVTARIRSILGEGDPISSTPPSDSSPFETTTP